MNLPLAGHTSAINDFVAGAFFSIKAEPVQISFCILSWFVTKKTHPPGPKIIPINTVRTAGQQAVDLQDPQTRRGFNVSDPFGGYPTKDDNKGALGPQDMILLEDGFSYGPTNGNDCYDVPLDDPNQTSNLDNNRDAADLAMLMAKEGMTRQYRVIKLQRLANPSEAWDSDLNPYLTVDVFDMDLVAFNGVASEADINADTSTTLAEKPDTASTLERGTDADLEFGEVEWSQRDLFRSVRGNAGNIPPSSPLAQNTHRFGFALEESLGKINQSYAAAGGEFFTSLAWNNRPYVSHTELANVPFASPEYLTRNFSTEQVSVDHTAPNPIPYNVYAGDENLVRGRFHHLLNFFANDSDAGNDDVSDPENDAPRANLYRIMDYLEVPSRFVGTEQPDSRQFYKPPFNSHSRYRVPGKINLNTIYGSEVWNALQMNDACTWDLFQASRKRWHLNESPPMLGAQPDSNPYPTDFVNPFRPAGDGVNVPEPSEPSDPSDPIKDLQITGPGTTIWRNKTKGFDEDPAAPQQPLFDFSSTTPYVNSNRNAYFRNLQRQRLGNLVTNKSSVFAIWITVGYFEVDQSGLIGAEMGADTGNVKRERGFFMFDRSIPMAFEPGKNHNIENGVLVETIIE
ncbi:hypothetical protein OAE44_00735 [bacterium]|nr:hypothetical protein [bacterium]